MMSSDVFPSAPAMARPVLQVRSGMSQLSSARELRASLAPATFSFAAGRVLGLHPESVKFPFQSSIATFVV